MPRMLTDGERHAQAVRLALDVLQTEADSEPKDPKHECEVTLGPDVWRRFVALARQIVTARRGPTVPGICRSCGCTWLASCQGGCMWADKTMTLCSKCAKG